MESPSPSGSTSAGPAHRLHIDVVHRSDSWADAGLDSDRLVTAMRAAHAVARSDAECEAALILGDDRLVRELNRVWRNADKPTNVLAFPAEANHPSQGSDPLLLGDVVLAYETVSREAGELGLALDAHASHLAVHGLLHLLGYDHDNEEQAAEMEGLEGRILAGLGLHDPYDEGAERQPARAMNSAGAPDSTSTET